MLGEFWFFFSIVTTIPLSSELAPSARGTLLAFNVAAMAAARLVSSLVAVRLWNAGGLAVNTYLSAGLAIAALFLLAALIHERKPAIAPVAAR